MTHDINAEFTRIFHLPLYRFIVPSLWGGYCFDIVAFAQAVNTPDGVSCANHITTVFGPEADPLIMGLIYRGGGCAELRRPSEELLPTTGSPVLNLERAPSIRVGNSLDMPEPLSIRKIL